MLRRIKSSDKKIFFLIFLTFLYIVLQTVEQFFATRGLHVFNGVLMSFQFTICFLLVSIDFKIGRLISQLCLSLSLFLFCLTFYFTRNIAPIPGFCSTIIYFITITILAQQFERRNKENISDFLTGLLNERGLNNLLTAKIEKQKPFFLLGIHIKNFSIISANYGHSFGQNLLKIISSEIQGILNNHGTVSLIKGTEFYIVMDGDVYATGLAFGLINKLSEKKTIFFNDNEVDVYLDIYAGFSKFPDDAQTADALLRASDIAIYHSITGKAKISHFESQMEEYVTSQLRIEKLIKSSLQNNYFYLVYQPQFTLNGKKLRGFETLIRMNSPHGDGVCPAQFIPIAEKSDLILKIDDYVMLHAMKEFAGIVQKNKDLIISINVSAKNISSPEFPSKVLHLLTQTDFPAENLEIEITEYCLIQSLETTIDNIKELRKIGIMVALDDFGTGYTSLSYLAKMPVNLLKIDKSLIDDIETDPKCLEFINTVISLGHLMNCEVISEGVENDRQLDLLKEKNCDLIQGYVWGKPLQYEVAKNLAMQNN